MILPHPYLTRIKDYFKAQTKTWDFFATQKAKEQEWAEFKNNLLKNAYRMSPETETDLYARLQSVKQKLGIQQEVTLYQLQGNPELNAFISFQQNEAHLVFCGPILKLLQGDEINALMAHELGHILLYTIDNGDYQVTNSIITAIANDSRSENVYLETARYFRLYTEIFCDRSALQVTGSEAISQASLIKINTGLDTVSATNYLKQAKEILQGNAEVKSENETHPENFIRVLALHLYNTTPATADEEITKLIEHRLDMDKLDIFMQMQLAGHTRTLLNEFTGPGWIQTDAVIAMCAQYFNDFIPDKAVEGQQWPDTLLAPNVKEYLSYVLMDLALADPQLEDVPLGRAFQLSEQFNFKNEFNTIIKKERKLSDKRLRELQAKALSAVSKVE